MNPVHHYQIKCMSVMVATLGCIPLPCHMLFVYSGPTVWLENWPATSTYESSSQATLHEYSLLGASRKTELRKQGKLGQKFAAA
eukprot:6227245-Amphidinium_carterae.1